MSNLLIEKEGEIFRYPASRALVKRIAKANYPFSDRVELPWAFKSRDNEECRLLEVVFPAPPSGDVVTATYPQKVGEDYIGGWDSRSFTPEEIAENDAKAKEGFRKTLFDWTKNHINSIAREKHHSDIVELISFSTSTIPKLKNGALNAIVFRDGCLVHRNQVVQDVKNGGVMPTHEVFIAALPDMVWP